MNHTNRFIGRELELERLLHLVDAHRLVTVWGPPGIGKTRLVEELLSKRRGTFCDLSDARTEDDVTAAVSRFASRDVGVLVLDNFEQVIECASSIRALSKPNRILVTSRERLRLEGEVCLEVGPLDVDGAMALFLDRLQLGLDVTDQADPSRPSLSSRLRDLVVRLDCIPLALELAAARHDVLGVDGLASRIDEPIPLLTRGLRDAPDRHATLEAAIGWSWDALPDRERTALMECSSFRGGFMLEAAEAVVEGAPVLDVLQSLRDKSMLRTEAKGGERRFSMLESVRDFAERKLLLEGHERSVWSRHTTYFARLSHGLVEERANLLIAVERSLDAPGGLADDGVHALVALEPSLGASGPYHRYLALLDRALTQRPREPRLLRARGKILQRMGRLDRAEVDLAAALDIARERRDALDEGTYLTDLGVLRHQERRLDEAEALYRQALSMHRAAGHRRAEGRVLGNLGAVEHDRMAYDRAEAEYEAALAIDREVGDARHEGLFLAHLGILDHERGDLGRAIVRYEDALRILVDVKDDRLLAITLGNRGVLHHALGELDLAAARHRRALDLLADVGDQRSLGLGMIRLAAVEAMLGEDAAARLSSAEAHLARPRDDLGLALADLAGGFLDVAAAVRTWLSDAPDETMARLREARRRIQRASDSPMRRSALERRAVNGIQRASDSPMRRSALERRAVNGIQRAREGSLLDRSDDARLLARILAGALARFDGGEPSLAIAPGARSLRPPSGSWTDLSRRHPIRRMLVVLVESAARGHRWLTMEELREAAWPGETIQSEAASNRVYVALTTLRKLGLAEILISGEAGYRLDPRIPISFSRT